MNKKKLVLRKEIKTDFWVLGRPSFKAAGPAAHVNSDDFKKKSEANRHKGDSNPGPLGLGATRRTNWSEINSCLD